MGNYSVPEEIRAMKPKGTMVKAISGRYYVYEYRCVSEGGVSRTRMGKCVGKITEGEGFVPNDNAAESSNAAVRAAVAAVPKPVAEGGQDAEIARLRARVAELEAALAAVRETSDRALSTREC